MTNQPYPRHQADLIDQYLDALARDPQAAAPPGLDAETAALLRALAQAAHTPLPNRATQDRIWQQALSANGIDHTVSAANTDPVQPDQTQPHSIPIHDIPPSAQPSANGHRQAAVPANTQPQEIYQEIYGEQPTMTQLTAPPLLQTEQRPRLRKAPFITLAAALLAVAFFGSMLVTLANGSLAGLSAGPGSSAVLLAQDATPTPVPGTPGSSMPFDDSLPAESIQPGDVVSGEITSEAPEAAYTFTAPEAMSVLVQVDADFPAGLFTVTYLDAPTNGSGGGGGGGGGGPVNQTVRQMINLEAGARLRIQVTDYNAGGGSYTLRLLGVAADPLAYSTPVSATLDEPNAIALYTLEAEVGDVVSIYALGEGFDPRLELYYAGNALMSDEDSGSGVNPEIEGFQLAYPGRYLVLLESADGMAGDYEIGMTFIENQPVPTMISPMDSMAGMEDTADIVLGDVVTGSLDDETRSLTYTLRIEEAGMYVVYAISDDFVPVITQAVQFDAGGGGGGGGGGSDAAIPERGNLINLTEMQGPGQMWLTVRSLPADATGDFLLTVQPLTATSLAYDETISASLDAETPVLAFGLEAAAGDVISAQVSSDDGLDTRMALLAPFGMELARDDDSGQGSSPELLNVPLPESGMYYLVVDSVIPGEAGVFELSLSLSDRIDTSTEEPVPLALGQAVSSSIAQGERAAAYTVSVDEDTVLEITLLADFPVTLHHSQTPGPAGGAGSNPSSTAGGIGGGGGGGGGSTGGQQMQTSRVGLHAGDVLTILVQSALLNSGGNYTLSVLPLPGARIEDYSPYVAVPTAFPPTELPPLASQRATGSGIPINLGDAVSGTITAEQDAIMYSFSTAEAVTVSLGLETGFYAVLDYVANNALAAESTSQNSGGGGGSGGHTGGSAGGTIYVPEGTTNPVTLWLDAGAVMDITVSGMAGTAGSFTLRLQAAPDAGPVPTPPAIEGGMTGPPDTSNAQPVTLNAPVTGAVSADAPQMVFAFTPDAPGSATVTLESEFRAVLSHYAMQGDGDGSGNVDGGGGGGSAPAGPLTIELDFLPGEQHYLIVAGADASAAGSFTLTLVTE